MSTKDKSTTIGDRPKIERLFLGVGTGAGLLLSVSLR
jgi:hypothetical protein